MLDVKTLRDVLDYDPETGKLFWKVRPVSLFQGSEKLPAEAQSRGWNKAHAGKEAFTSTTCYGYKQGTVFCKRTEAHRVIWALVYGEWPDGEVDHINGDRLDNRLANLRVVSRAENQRNKKRQSNNKSGVPGVYVHTPTGAWRAQITVNRKRVHLGLFESFEDAVAAKKAAEATHGFHENHGR